MIITARERSLGCVSVHRGCLFPGVPGPGGVWFRGGRCLVETPGLLLLLLEMIAFLAVQLLPRITSRKVPTTINSSSSDIHKRSAGGRGRGAWGWTDRQTDTTERCQQGEGWLSSQVQCIMGKIVTWALPCGQTDRHTRWKTYPHKDLNA